MELQEKEEKYEKHLRKLFSKNPKIKGVCLLTLAWQSFRSEVKGKHTAAYYNNEWTCQKNEEVELVQPVQVTWQIPMKKTQAGYISTMTQEFERGSKWKTKSPTYPFL